MIEAFILSIVMCDPDPLEITQCDSMISAAMHDNEQDCIVELMEQALPWVMLQGKQVTGFSCGPYEVPVLLDDPA